MADYSVRVENLTKVYPMIKKKGIIPFLKANKTQFLALDDISFTAEHGDTIGVVGINGAGKSTLMLVLAGLLEPTIGSVTIDGESSLLAVGAGIDGFLTGRENIRYKCMLMGFDKKQTAEIEEEAIRFAEVGAFIDQPMRTWSSGMRARIGFAVAVFTNPDVLIIDEALSVGDATFSHKCLDKIHEIRDRGKTIFLVSHSMSLIRQFCDKTLWLHNGRLQEYGAAAEVCEHYKVFVEDVTSLEAEQKARIFSKWEKKRTR